MQNRIFSLQLQAAGSILETHSEFNMSGWFTLNLRTITMVRPACYTQPPHHAMVRQTRYTEHPHHCNSEANVLHLTSAPLQW